jgi:uncharacterized protein (TIGR03435 family)
MRLLIPAVTIALVPVVVTAQQFLAAPAASVDPNARFEVVVIKPVEPGSGGLMRMTPGAFESSVPIGLLLRQALQKADYQISGAPGWTDTERYSIRAKAPEGTPPGATPVLLLNLLKDRFGLVTHLETREQAISHLVMARADRRPGPDLKPTPADCQATIAEREENAKRGGPPAPMPASFPGPDDPLPCGSRMTGFGSMRMSGSTIAQFLPALADLIGRPVVDRTGLTGRHDISLTYRHDGRVPGLMGILGMPPGFEPPAVDPNAPSLVAALQEQLGLKLESARGPVEVAVIDRLEKPALD